MRDKGYGIFLAALGMGACCIGLPLLVAAIAGGGLVAWLGDNALTGFLVIVGGLAALALVRRSKRRASEIERRASADPGEVDRIN